MDVYQCLRSRRTVRDYKPDPIPQELVRRILKAGRWAPSSSNTQKWHFIVIQERDTLQALGKIATQGTFIAQAPLTIAIVMDEAPRPQLDAGRALQQMELMAWSSMMASIWQDKEPLTRRACLLSRVLVGGFVLGRVALIRVWLLIIRGHHKEVQLL